jgi:NADH-quinone oxidoreductase subunit L
MSQIGYMFVGAGVGAYANGMFHLMTHAFFKALLFMGAGLAIHALAGEQDIRNMGGIGALMPWTRRMFLVASLALVGIFPFAGFFSKDSILAAALHTGHWYGWLFWLGALAGTFLTGLYTFRLYFVVFPGEPSAFVREHYGSHHAGDEPHRGEGPWVMVLPCAVLTVLSLVGGLIQFAPFWHLVTDWLEPVSATLRSAEPTHADEWISVALSLTLGLAGIAVAYAIYMQKRIAVPRMAALQRALEHKLYVDELYDALFYTPFVALANRLRQDVEEPIILASAGDLGDTAIDAGGAVRRLQTGLLRTYVFFLGLGTAVLALVFLVTR